MACIRLRRFKVTFSTLNPATGETTKGRTEWRTAECGAPLFDEAERTRGTCRSCAKGWRCADNYPCDPFGNESP